MSKLEFILDTKVLDTWIF